MEEEMTVFSTKFWNIGNERPRITQRSLFQEALINTMRVSRGATVSTMLLCRLLQPPVAKLHQSCWPESSMEVSPLLGWDKYQIRHHLPTVFTCFPSPPLCSCILSFSVLFIPLQLCIPQRRSWWGGNREAPPREETLECGQKEGKEVAGFPNANAKGSY